MTAAICFSSCVLLLLLGATFAVDTRVRGYEDDAKAICAKKCDKLAADAAAATTSSGDAVDALTAENLAFSAVDAKVKSDLCNSATTAQLEDKKILIDLLGADDCAEYMKVALVASSLVEKKPDPAAEKIAEEYEKTGNVPPYVEKDAEAVVTAADAASKKTTSAAPAKFMEVNAEVLRLGSKHRLGHLKRGAVRSKAKYHNSAGYLYIWCFTGGCRVGGHQNGIYKMGMTSRGVARRVGSSVRVRVARGRGVAVQIMFTCQVTSTNAASAYHVEQHAHGLLRQAGYGMLVPRVRLLYSAFLRSGHTEWFATSRNNIVNAINNAAVALGATGTC